MYNVPPPTNVESIKKLADTQPPPKNFYELQLNSVVATKRAIADGYKLLEVEFPPLPSNVLEMDDVSSSDVAATNLNLALDFAKAFAENEYSIAIMLPDEAEQEIIMEKVGTTADPFPGVKISSLRRSEDGDNRIFKPEQVFLSLFGGRSSGAIKAIDGVTMYVIIIASAQELPDVEELHELDPNAVIVMYNLKLDVLRGDIGNPAFPPKELHDRFLSQVKPVYYLRTRQYSRSTPKPPFIVNYQGCLFRSYPGNFQTLLDVGDGRAYRRILGNKFRPPLGVFKAQLTNSLKVDGTIQEESDVLNFLRTGYKTTTWWEEKRENASDAWRT